MTPQWDLLTNEITPAIRKIALQRLISGERLLKKGVEYSKLPPKRQVDVKLALILVHSMNPYEDFGAEEEAAIRGISTDTLANRRQDARKPLKNL